MGLYCVGTSLARDGVARMHCHGWLDMLEFPELLGSIEQHIQVLLGQKQAVVLSKHVAMRLVPGLCLGP